MPSSTSNFKRILRLPRLFFRKPTEAESVHGGPPLEFERPIPQIPWRGITVIVVSGRYRRRVRVGILLSLDRLWSHSERHRGSLDDGTPARATRVRSSSSAIPAAGSISISTNCKKV